MFEKIKDYIILRRLGDIKKGEHCITFKDKYEAEELVTELLKEGYTVTHALKDNISVANEKNCIAFYMDDENSKKIVSLWSSIEYYERAETVIHKYEDIVKGKCEY